MKISFEIDPILTKISGWENAVNLQIGPLSGLTNTNDVVMANGLRFVLRIEGFDFLTNADTTIPTMKSLL